MADKKFTITPGGRVVIEINSQSKVQSPKSKVQAAKGLIAARREDEYLPRRLKKGGGINFYDLGQFAVGEEYQTYDGLIQATLSYAEGLDTIQTVWEADYQSNFTSAMNSEIFGVAYEDRKNTFFPIIKGDVNFERYFEVEFGAYNDELINLPDSVWTDKGLVVADADRANLIIRPHGVLFNSSEIDFSTVTIKDGETDEDVEGFSLAKTADIFLMPNAIVNNISAFYKDGLVNTGIFTDFVNVHEFANQQLQIFPRELLGEYNGYVPLMTDVEALYWYLAIIAKQFPGARGRKLVQTPSGSSYAYNFTTVSPGVIPNENYFDENGGIEVDSSHFGETLLTNFGYLSTFIEPTKALIFQNNHWYYVWQPV